MPKNSSKWIYLGLVQDRDELRLNSITLLIGEMYSLHEKLLGYGYVFSFFSSVQLLSRVPRVVTNEPQHASPPCPSILRHSAFFTVQLSYPYMTTGKTIALTRQILDGKDTVAYNILLLSFVYCLCILSVLSVVTSLFKFLILLIWFCSLFFLDDSG